jgi:hypothetical protein
MQQCAPVVRNGGRRAVCAVSLRTQPVFQQFEILRLSEPLRQGNDLNFSNFLDSIGDNCEDEEVDLGCLSHTQSPAELLDFVFPRAVVGKPRECLRRAILSPFNQAVDDFNAEVLTRVPGMERSYLSHDWIDDEDKSIVDMETNPLASPEFLNSQSEAGIPPHELKLRIGAVVRFTRNLNPNKDITKNTRAIVRSLNRYSVEVETLPMDVSGRALPSVRHDSHSIRHWG